MPFSVFYEHNLWKSWKVPRRSIIWWIHRNDTLDIILLKLERCPHLSHVRLAYLITVFSLILFFANFTPYWWVGIWTSPRTVWTASFASLFNLLLDTTEFWKFPAYIFLSMSLLALLYFANTLPLSQVSKLIHLTLFY